MYCVYGNSGWYIHGGPLFGGGPLLGGFVIGGSTVYPPYRGWRSLCPWTKTELVQWEF